MAHALLSPSCAKQWLACPPSIRFGLLHEAPTASEDAARGTLAHAMAETLLANALGRLTTRKYNAEMKKHRADPLYSVSMDDYLEEYVQYVLARIEEAKKLCPDPEIMLEARLDYSPWVPEGSGIGDVVIVATGHVDVIDLKYGVGVPVSAEENPQTRLYGLGAYNELSMIYDVKQVTAHIVQPRLESTTSETLTTQELLTWAENVVKPAAALAFEGKGEFVAGDHCRWCRAKNVCREYAFDKLELAKMDFKPGPELTDEEIAEIIGKAQELASWAKQIKEYAQAQALNHSKIWPGWKLVSGRANRVITDEAEAIARLELEGVEPEKILKLRGLGELEDAVGKKRLPEILSGILVKPEGSPTLVPESDKRPALSRSAEEDFKEAI